MKRGLSIQKKWKWIAGIFAVCLLIFTAVGLYRHLDVSQAAGPYTFTNSNGDIVAAGSTMELRRATDVLTLSGYETGDTYEWSSTDPSILQVSGASYTANLQVQGKVGDVTVNVKITHKDAAGNITSEEVVSLTVSVLFSINEHLSGAAPAGVKMDRIKPDDERKSLIMDYGRLPAGSTDLNDVEKTSIGFGTSAVTEPGKLNLIFGDATATSTRWSSGNNDIVMVNEGTHTLTAMGTGTTTLSVEYTDGTTIHTDSIRVYVRPILLDKDDTVIAGATGTDTQIVEVHNKDMLGITAAFITNPLENIGDKVSWVISKGEGESTVLVRDSLGNTGEGGKDARLVWQNGEQKYRIDARAGIYNIQFYVKGTYTNFADAKANPPACQPVSLQAKVLADYKDKNVTVNVGGSYNLAEAFNIPDEVFRDNFDVSYLDNESSTYIKINSNKEMIDAIKLGTGKLKVHPHPNSEAADIPGMPADLPDVEVTITVSETFVMSQSSVTLPVGSSTQLYGVIGSGTVAESTSFSWNVSDSSYVSIDTNEGQYATIKALRRTPVGSPVIVTLTWQDEDAVYHTATCTVTVTESVNNFTISPATETLEIGGPTKVLETKLSGTQNIQWLSSDPNKVTVAPLAGNGSATIAPGKATGQAVITAINLDNGVYATCLVTVTAPITSLSIDKGTSYETTLAEGIVQLRAIYQPANATDTTMQWLSSDPDIATVDEETGRVTLLKEGTTRITVQPKYVNPNGVYAYCDIYIKEDPIIKITPSETEIDMIAGDTYEVIYTLTPENPSDRTVRWSSSDEKVARVEGGVITAVSAGDATISITGGKVGSETDPVTIKVHVRNRLQNIEFATRTTYVAVGGTQQLTVLFTPNVHINDKLVWRSSDDSIVTVSDEGVITGVKVGSAMISCYAEDMEPDHLITCMVYVTDGLVVANDLKVLPEAETIQVGQTLQMSAVFDPDNTTDQSIRWSSSDESIITITDGGLVSGVAVGQATVTAIYYNTPDGMPWIRYSKITVEPATVVATGFEVTPDSANIKVKETFRITPVFTPDNTTDKTVEYQSTDESVATVDENGLVRGVGAGDALIQCQAISGGFIDACAVHVENAIDFRLSPSTREIAVGKSFNLKKVTVPSNADKTATWSSSNTKIATVNSSGKVTGKKIGSCTITCTLTEYNQSATCRVKVAKLNSTVKLNKKSLRVGVGKTKKLKATVWSNNSKNPSLTWKSANKKIATVSSKGKVKGKRLGVTKVTVVTKDKVKAKATCRITVIRPVTSVSITTKYAVCYVGHTKKLKANVKPKNASIKKLKWTSSNKSIATVSGSGKVTGIKEGEVTITAKAKDGSGKKSTCLVKILEAVPTSSVVVAQTELTMKKGDSTKLSYTVLPDNHSDKLKFASDNKRVATVSSKGKVKAVGTGTATITILAGSGVTSTVTVNVVSLDRETINMRQYDTETLQVLGTDEDITWYTANSRIATVTNGTIVGRGIGSTYIYAYVKGCKMACLVNVVSVNQ